MHTKNPYAAPQSSLETSNTNERTAQLISAFIGCNKEYYSRHIGKFLQGKKLLGFNFCAAIFTIPWLAYRKMYSAIAAYMLAIFTPLIAIEVLHQALKISAEEKVYLTLLVLFSLKLLLGLFGNLIYFKRAKKISAKIQCAIEDDDYALVKISSAGGKSDVACMLALIASTVINIISRLS